MEKIEKIKFFIKSKGFTMKSFAEALGYSTQNIYSIFNGKTNLTLDLFEKMLKVLGITIQEFYEESNKIQKNNSYTNTSSNIQTSANLTSEPKVYYEKNKLDELDSVGKIKYLIKKRGITISNLAEKLECSRTVIYNIFYYRTSITIEILEKIAKILDVDASTLLDSNEKSNIEIKHSGLDDFFNIEEMQKRIDTLIEKNEKLINELEFFKQTVEMKDLMISQLIEINKIKENNSSDEKAKKSA